MSGSQTPNQLNSPLDSELGHLGGKGDPKQSSNWNREVPFKKLQRTDSERVRDTLPPEFKTADDQEALGNFMGGEGEELLTIVDEIRKIEALRNIELDIPQLVVVGGTSAGKSSILQALTRLPFPVATQLCTRFVTETTIRRCASSEKPGYRIEVKMDNSSHILAAPLEPMIFDDDNWQTVELNLKQDIADVFEAMSVDNLPTATVSKSNGSFKKHTEQTVTRMPQLLRHRVQITVRTKDQAFFSIVDIPGLISHGAPQDEKLSKELIVEYIKNKEAIILAVIPATNAPENEAVFRLIADNKASDRTIGVITKCDKIDGDPGKIFDLLRNRKGDDHLNLGWFAVRNRGPDEISGQANFEERDRKETELFASGKWKEALLNPSLLKSIDSNVLGIKNLKHAVRKTMNKQVKENFPRLKAQMKDLKRENEKQLKRMGDPRTDPKEQRRYLSKVQALYENEVDKSLNGDYRAPKDHTHASHLRYHIKKFNDEYAKEMEYKGYKYMWRLEEDHTVPEIQGKNKGAGPQIGIFEWIYQTWDYLIGSEVKGDIPQNLKKKLFDEQAESWEARARSYIEKVKEAIRDCNEDLFKEACKDDGLRWKIQELLEQLETKAFVAAEAEFDNILGDLGYIGSWHPMLDGDIELYQKKRATRQVQRDNPSDQPNQSRDSAQQTDSVEQLALSLTAFAAHNKRIYEIHDWLFAFWKVAFPRFVDNIIIQVVERHLLSQNGPLRLFNRDWVDDLSDEDLQRLAGEDEATTNERQSIKDKLQGLNDALEKTNHVMH